MKKLFFWLLLFFFSFPALAYQQQGFSEYKESLLGFSFSCQSQCVALIGPVNWTDYVDLKGAFSWVGIVWYGFLVGQQVIPWHTLNVQGDLSIDQQFDFSSLPFWSQIPADAQLVFLAQGNIQWNLTSIQTDFLGLGQKFVKWWNDFWKVESLTPYSINLRYGATILSVSVVKIWYIIFLIAWICLFMFKKSRNNKQYLLYAWFWIFLIIWIRNLVTYMTITHQWLQWYTYQDDGNKKFFDLGDYIAFTKKIREKLNLDTYTTKNCTLFVDSFQDWPFKTHWESVYLKPCKFVLTWSEADYSVYYKKPVSGTVKNVLIDFNWSYLLQNK